MRVISAGARLAIEPRHGLEVVVHHVGRRGCKDFERAVQTSADIRHENLDRGLRTQLPDGMNAVDEMLSTTVAQVVAIDAGDDDIRQFQL